MLSPHLKRIQMNNRLILAKPKRMILAITTTTIRTKKEEKREENKNKNKIIKKIKVPRES